MTPTGDRRLVPPYVWTTGRTRPSRNVLDRLTVLRAATDRVPPGVSPAGRQVLAHVLAHGALPLVELAARLSLPVSFVKVLASDLFDQGWLVVRAPAPPGERDRERPDPGRPNRERPDGERPDEELLARVIDGLRALP